MNAARLIRNLFAGALLGLALTFGFAPAVQGQESLATKLAAPLFKADVRAVDISSLPTAYPLAKGQARFAKLSEPEMTQFMGFYNQARSELEKYELMKALGAGHDLKAVEEFAQVIRGKSASWLRNNLRLANTVDGYGIRQQWSTSCAPATVQTLLGELDPIYAMLMRAANPNFNYVDDFDALRHNPLMALDQKNMLESASPWGEGGTAVARKKQGGKGRVINDLLNNHTAKTGLEYAFHKVESSFTGSQALAAMDVALAKLIPVPLHVMAHSGNKHFVLAVGMYYENNQKWYLIHDPWDGYTYSRSPAAFLNNRLQLAHNDIFNGVILPTIKYM